MRRALTLLAVAAWLGIHAFLWTLLPPMPRWTAPGLVPDSIAFTPDGRSLVTCDAADVRVWDRVTGRLERTVTRPGKRPTDGVFHSMMAMSPTDRRIIVYDTRGNRGQIPYLIDLESGEATALPTFGDIITSGDPCVGFLPDGRSLYQLSASIEDGGDVVMRVWSLPGGPPRSIPLEWRLYDDPSFSADGRRAVAHLHKNTPVPDTVLVLDISGGRIMRELVINPETIGTTTIDRRVAHAAMSPDGRTVAMSINAVFTGGAFGLLDVELFDAESGRLIRKLGRGFAPGWNASGDLVIHDGECTRLIQVPNGLERTRWPTSIYRDPGSAALTSDRCRVSYRVNRFRPEVIRWLLEHLPGQPFDPDDPTESYVVEDAQTGERLAEFRLEPATQLALAPDGSALATKDADGIRLWHIPPRTPGGIVLGLMIAEVGLFTAWTAWRRRLFRKRLAAATA
jgi:WD40 repeat protein